MPCGSVDYQMDAGLASISMVDESDKVPKIRREAEESL